MVKIKKKDIKKIKEIKISPDILEELLKKKEVEKKSDSIEEEINNLKFVEFLTPSTESIGSLASRKPKPVKRIENDEDVLFFAPKEETSSNFGKSKEKKEYFANSLREYDLISPREEKKQDISSISVIPKRVDFMEVGRDVRMQPREIFIPRKETFGMDSSNERREEKKYNIERVDFTEIGREKRYKLMK